MWKKLEAGNTVILLSPSSTPNKEYVSSCVRTLERWGMKVELGKHIFDVNGPFAGKDEDRLSDLNYAIRNPNVKAIFATRGGKGAYRIIKGIDFNALKNNPKPIIGFSETTILHLAVFTETGIYGIHGAFGYPGGPTDGKYHESFKEILMGKNNIFINIDRSNPTNKLTTTGKAQGILIGGNLDMLTTSSGWCLPNMRGRILFLEAIGMGLGQVDRQLSMLINSGHLDGIVGIVIGQFTEFSESGDYSILNILFDRLNNLQIPIVGGMPIGHEEGSWSIPIGRMCFLDANKGSISLENI